MSICSHGCVLFFDCCVFIFPLKELFAGMDSE